ncbi:hypothetical protein [uncultured Brevundimonas sp.]|uniref:hypothetical protein n=1 Tax=uncultured Brevundimonas sp. TaxID=213418 RepID=UPI0030EC31FD|tara:strand:- start:22558 stop:23010 length:453 start_codon:yes stop_codon:yes gene_type:complete
MKTALLAGLALLLSSAAALAQTGPAAATLPNSFDRTIAVPAAPAAPPIVQTMADERSEDALRDFIAGAAAGDIDTSNLSDDLITAITAQADQVTPLIQSFGAVQAVTFVGKRDGADLFSVLFANAETEWMIGFNDDGKIGALLFRPAPTE